MASIAQLLLVIVVLVLTFLITFVAFQAFQVLHEFRGVLKRLNRILEEEAPSPKIQKIQTKLNTSYPKTTHVVKRFFRRSVR